jgi:hypothetical protein
MSKWKRKIEKLQSEIIAARQQRDEEKRRAERVVKKTIRMGRPTISEELLKKAELLAYDHPLPWVAFKLEIALSTLYKHGITRKAINAKKVSAR